MAKKLRDDRSRIVIRVPAGVGQPIQQSTKQRFYGEGITHREVVAGTFCNSCRKAMLDKSQIGGVCISCGLTVCSACAANRCSMCNCCVCDSVVCSSLLRGQKVCNTHGFVAYLKFAFTKSR